MKIKCQKCGRKIDASNYLCPYCQGENALSDGEVFSLWQVDRKRRLKTRLIVTISVAVTLVLLYFILNANLLFPNQAEARRNNKAITAYVEKYYPKAVLVKKHYNSIENYLGLPTNDVFDYEQNGLRFSISAHNGNIDSVYDDGYAEALIIQDIHQNYLDAFFEERGISYRPGIIFYFTNANRKSYIKPGMNASFDTFPGKATVNVLLECEMDKLTPRDFDWLYEFYLYWKKNLPTEKCSLSFQYWMNENSYYSLNCDSSSEYANEDEFYDSFNLYVNTS